jgi:Fur family ferric uptake transcriptional regulator
MTPQRRVILEEVEDATNHPTADEIYEKVRKRIPRISMGTVYRNLDVLESLGAIRRLDSGRSQMRFDCNTKEHYHLTCTRCGRIEDVPIQPGEHFVDTLEEAGGKLTKYGIFGYQLEFFGLCSQCINTPKESPEGEEKDRLPEDPEKDS